MIKIKGLTKIFNSNGHDIVAVDNIDLTIQPAEFVIILGTNGSGKSTLLNLLAGSHAPTAGSIFFDQKEITSLKEYQRSAFIARLFQNPLAGTASELSIIDNFRLAALRSKSRKLILGNTKSFEEKVKHKVSLLQLGLEEKLHQPIGSLSGGQRQALTLLMATMDNMQLLLMDEPTSALDPRSAERVMELASRFIEELGISAIMVTHSLKEAHRYGNRIIQMDQGRIIKNFNESEKRQISLQQMIEWFA
ncbi:MAG: Methionine import ATP-binding protein MetN [Bacteroidetes bacterium ADurb.Bin141]|nr:MAG: Methionine import ATP-binding protein MetN [Bacteroidetes bacterium ADurb.Bin141]